MDKKKRISVILYILMALFLLLAVWVFINLSAGRTTFFGQASTSGTPDTGNSYVFASPVTARIGGDKIRITTFVLDGQGKGVAGKSVVIVCSESAACQSGGVLISPVQQMTDNLGQSIWEVSAAAAGKYTVKAVVESASIPQTVTIDFR